MIKKIIIDARLYGPKKTGIGRYTQNLLLALKKQEGFTKYSFGLIVKNEDLTQIKSDLGSSFSYHPTAITHYSLSEQFLLPQFISSLSPDLVHFTHFNKPLFYFGRSLITVHDLIKHFFRGQETTTRSALSYWPKYWIYRLLTDINLRLNPLIVPSNFWREYIVHHYHKNPTDITTTYEAVDPKFQPRAHRPTDNKIKNYILYTGNLYPHKNIEVIFRALKFLPDLKLKIICARSLFSLRAESLAKSLNVSAQVEFLGYVPDTEFGAIYSQALCLVHPSFMEGFSLTGLEAMSLSCPVIAANSSCLPEVYGQAVLYFDPKSENDLVTQINKLISVTDLRQKLISLGHQQASKYSWNTTAAATLAVYEKILKLS